MLNKKAIQSLIYYVHKQPTASAQAVTKDCLPPLHPRLQGMSSAKGLPNPTFFSVVPQGK